MDNLELSIHNDRPVPLIIQVLMVAEELDTGFDAHTQNINIEEIYINLNVIFNSNK